MYKLVFAPEFARDLDSTFEYISHVLCADKAAKELMKEIDDSIMNLKNMPYMYPECNEPLKSLGYRKIVVKNYILIYEVDDEKKNINLLRIFYGRSDYMRFLTKQIKIALCDQNTERFFIAFDTGFPQNFMVSLLVERSDINGKKQSNLVRLLHEKRRNNDRTKRSLRS